MNQVVPLYPDQASPLLANPEAEAAWLAAGLINNAVFNETSASLAPGSFFEPAHARIFEEAMKFITRGSAVTIITLRPYLEHDEAVQELGGIAYLARLTANGAGLLCPGELAQQIAELAAARATRAVLSEAIAELALPDASPLQILDGIYEHRKIVDRCFPTPADRLGGLD